MQRERQSWGQFLRRWLLLELALLLLVLIGWRASRHAVEPGPGVLAPQAPLQTPVTGAPPPRIDDIMIDALFDFDITARVLGAERYRFDAESALSPLDLALGWGRMSDSAVLARLDIAQAGRFYFYRWGADGPPIPPAEIVRSSANMHMVPLDAGVRALLLAIDPGQVVRLQGWLIAASRDDGWQWTSSTRRDDSGFGACELLLVRSVDVVATP